MSWGIVLSVITALAFTGAAAANAFDLGGTAKSFRDWGYPPAWRFVTAFLEIAGAALVVEPRTRPFGVALLGAVMVGALVTLARVRAGTAWLRSFGRLSEVYLSHMFVVFAPNRMRLGIRPIASSRYPTRPRSSQRAAGGRSALQSAEAPVCQEQG